MTNELIMVLSDFTQIMKDWEAGLIPTELEFIDKIKVINEKLIEELPKWKVPEVEDK